MPQLHLYVPEETAERLRAHAKAHGMSLSKYLSEIVRRDARVAWPEGYFEGVIGGWVGVPLERPEALELEDRQQL